jgi:hypothetical protein
MISDSKVVLLFIDEDAGLASQGGTTRSPA